MIKPAFANLTEAFLYCRDMDASLNERLEALREELSANSASNK